jgi:hypothetical protein
VLRDEMRDDFRRDVTAFAVAYPAIAHTPNGRRASQSRRMTARSTGVPCGRLSARLAAPPCLVS